MVSEISLAPTVANARASSTPAGTVDRGHQRMVGRALTRIGHFIARSLEAPYLPAEPVIEAQALVGLDMWTL